MSDKPIYVGCDGVVDPPETASGKERKCMYCGAPLTEDGRCSNVVEWQKQAALHSTTASRYEELVKAAADVLEDIRKTGSYWNDTHVGVSVSGEHCTAIQVSLAHLRGE
jgi:hypothetical protein